MRRKNGFTLIELLIVVAIIGIIAAIAIPNLLNAIDRSKQKKTMAEMRSIGTACEEYSIDHSFYPNQSGTLTAFTTATIQTLEPNYIKKLPTMDGWRNILFYSNDVNGNGTATGYTIESAGKDGVGQNTTDAPGTTNDFDCNIIFMQGQFIAYPEGQQT